MNILIINVPVCFKAWYVASLKTIKYKHHKNNWYIGSFMYPSAVV